LFTVIPLEQKTTGERQKLKSFLVNMKFYATFALALLPFVFANPIAEPGPFAEAAELAESDGPPATLAEDFDSGSLDKRQSCYVSGREAGLNV
jgi:hypothetical protein